MAVRPYPSNTIILYIDERFMNRELKLALDRSWTHVGDTIVRTHTPPEDVDPYNFIHVKVKYGTRNYLLSDSCEEADANWEERMEKHLSNTIVKIGNNTKVFNRNQRKEDAADVVFDHIEISLESGALTLQFRLDSNSDLPVECAHIASQIRTLLNAGILGEGVKRVIVPSLHSYEQQENAFLDRAALIEAEKAAAEDAARKAEEEARIAAEEAAEELFLESPSLAEEHVVAEETEKETVGVTPLTPEEWEAEYGFEPADFAIDYQQWELVYDDGSHRSFDSSQTSFLS